MYESVGAGMEGQREWGLVKRGVTEAEEVEDAEAEGEKGGGSMNRSSSTNSVANLR